METVFVALGSNLGNRAENLRKAVEALSPHVTVQKKSSIYESVPQGVAGPQSFYFNAVISGGAELEPRALLSELKKIEQAMGRKPDMHNEPRVIDLDILLYGDTVLETPELIIPHPRMHERAFVIAPFAYMAPLTVHPKLGLVIADLEDKLGNYFDDAWEVQERL